MHRCLTDAQDAMPNRQDSKLITVEQFVATLEESDDGTLGQAEWIANLSKCAGFAHYLADNVDENGDPPMLLDCDS